MIRRPPRSTLDRSSAASDVYKRQSLYMGFVYNQLGGVYELAEDYERSYNYLQKSLEIKLKFYDKYSMQLMNTYKTVSYTHLRAHETVLDLVCRLLLEKKKNKIKKKKKKTNKNKKNKKNKKQQRI